MFAFAQYRELALSAATAAMLASPTIASPMLNPVQEGNVTYLTGGIGQNEANAIKSQGYSYDLQISSSDKHGRYMPDTNFTIQSMDGRQMISANDAGPLFYVQLPPGTYKIEATNGKEHWNRTVTVSANKPADIHIVWKRKKLGRIFKN